MDGIYLAIDGSTPLDVDVDVRFETSTVSSLLQNSARVTWFHLKNDSQEEGAPPSTAACSRYLFVLKFMGLPFSEQIPSLTNLSLSKRGIPLPSDQLGTMINFSPSSQWLFHLIMIKPHSLVV